MSLPECINCEKDVFVAGTLHRINKKGEPAVNMCIDCIRELGVPVDIDPTVEDICFIIQNDGKRG